MPRVLLTGLLLVATAACGASVSRYPMRVQAYALDFRTQTQDGFFMSPDPYTGAHEPIGIITVEIRAKAEMDPSSQGVYNEWTITPIPVDSGLAAAKAHVRALGGDALVNLKINRSREVVSPMLALPTLEVSGLAIKRASR